MVTAIAHVWFNAYFEGGHEGHDSGVFAIEWEAMDGIKGSSRKGTKALDRLTVVWRYVKREGDDEGTTSLEQVITEPAKGEPVPENEPADWRGEDDQEVRPSDGVDSGRSGGAALTMSATVRQGASTLGKELGLRKSEPDSANLSRASSIKDDAGPSRKSTELRRAEESDSDEAGVKPYGPEGEDRFSVDGDSEEKEGRRDNRVGHGMEAGLAKTAHVVSKMKDHQVKQHDLKPKEHTA